MVDISIDDNTWTRRQKIAMLINLGIGAFAGIIVFRPNFLTLDSAFCLAVDDSNEFVGKINPGLEAEYDYIDVAARFNLVFKVIFYASVAYFGALLLSRTKLFSYDIRSKLREKVMPFAQSVSSIAAIVGVYFRIKHSGRVCSGDFDDDHVDGELFYQGLFFGICFILLMTVFVLLLFAAIQKLYYKIRGQEYKTFIDDIEMSAK